MAEKSAQLRFYERNKEKYREYDRNTYYSPRIRIRNDNEEMIAFLKSKANISQYVQDLIREDMKKGSL